ncbi:MAG: hypothetical protein OHK0015_40470 [Chloroflexi bacterium OHK40]
MYHTRQLCALDGARRGASSSYAAGAARGARLLYLSPPGCVPGPGMGALGTVVDTTLVCSTTVSHA